MGTVSNGRGLRLGFTKERRFEPKFKDSYLDDKWGSREQEIISGRTSMYTDHERA